MLLLQELKGTEFSSAFFKELGYESVSVTQKAYNGVAILSRSPIEIVSTTLPATKQTVTLAFSKSESKTSVS